MAMNGPDGWDSTFVDTFVNLCSTALGNLKADGKETIAQ